MFGLLCAVLVSLTYANDSSQYEFGYAVNDPITGDQKDQKETRDGDNVSGYYRTLDSDGLLRTVKYRADAVNGFTAEVVREPVPGATVKAAVPLVTRAHAVPAPAAIPAPYYLGSPSYGYSYRPPYSYNYQPYSYTGYQAYPYSYGYQPYGYNQYPFGVHK